MLGKELGAYTTGNLLASGNYATIHAVENRDDLLLKLLPETLTEDASFKSRFDMALETLVQLEHPHLMRLHDYGIEETIPYLVMPRLDHTLEAQLADGRPMPPDKALVMLANIADVLDMLHEQGFVHQDVKSSNILFDKDGKVYLSDLGILPLMRETYELLAQALPAGSVAFRAPEQLRGDNISPTTDVYALGVVAFQCLTGKLPFADDAEAIQNKPPARPTSLNAELPSGVDDVFLKALSKQSNRRYPTATELINALQGAFAPPATEDNTSATDSTESFEKQAFSPLKFIRRMGCGAALLAWFALMLSPCIVITVLVEGEFVISLSDVPNHQLRMFDVDTDDTRGFGFSQGSIESETDDEVCVITRVRYIMWRGSNEPVNFCQCYQKINDRWFGGPVLDQQCDEPRQLSSIPLLPKPATYYELSTTSQVPPQ